MIPIEITEDLRNGMGLEECLIKHNTNLKTLLHKEYPNMVKSANERKYIEKRGQGYHIKKKIKYKTYYFGHYASFEDAMKVRDKLICIGWEQNKVNSICEELGVKRIPSKNEHRYYE